MNVHVEPQTIGMQHLEGDKPALDLHRHIALFRRRLRLFLAVLITVFAAVMLVTLQLTPRYTSTSTVMIDTRTHKVVDIQQVMSGLGSDTGTIDSEVEILRSRSLAEKVVDQLDLVHDPEFNKRLKVGHGPVSMISGLLGRGPKGDPVGAEARSATIGSVMTRLKVARQGLTYVLNVSFQSESPKRAALIANTFAERYLTEQLDAKFDATRRANAWLSQRLQGLRQQVETAEHSVEMYKASNGLMGLGGPESTTITQQEISNLNTQLATARAQQAESDARLSTARQQLAKGSTGEDVGEALGSPVIQDLRKQRAAISGQLADMSARYGPKYPDVLKAQRQLADIDGQIQAEVKRLISNLDAQAQVSRQRTSSIAGSLGGSRASLGANNLASVKLAELQRNAESVRTLYQSFLDRFKQTSTDQGLEQSDARVVSAAVPAGKASFPNLLLSAVLGLILAIATAVGILFVMEALEAGLYTSEDVERTLNVPYMGATPQLSSVLDGLDKKSRVSPARFVVEKPLSSFSEAFRALKTSLLASRIGEKVKVIAITSSLPNEGKTTTSICLARVLALGGAATLVIDCDLRRRTVNRLFAEEPKVGLLEVLNGSCTLDDAMLRDEETGAYFLPVSKSSFTPKDVFSTPAMDQLIAQARARFDIVLLDTAPVLPVADTRVIAPKADVVLFLAQWKRTPRKAIENALKQLQSVGAHVPGIALTQVDMKEQARSGYGDASYYYRAYRSYYHS